MPLDVSYYVEIGPLYIPTKINDQIVTRLMVDLTCRVDVIIEENMFINGWHRWRYDKFHATLYIHDRLSLQHHLHGPSEIQGSVMYVSYHYQVRLIMC